jgi:hypothetical protein
MDDRITSGIPPDAEDAELPSLTIRHGPTWPDMAQHGNVAVEHDQKASLEQRQLPAQPAALPSPSCVITSTAAYDRQMRLKWWSRSAPKGAAEDDSS